jgi:hypothetical protein
MKKKYSNYTGIISLLCLTLVIASCSKKDDAVTPTNVVTATPQSLGTFSLYEYASGSDKRIFIPLTQIGTVAISYYGIFDTGSTGMTIDANGILPPSMITSSGIQVTGDSVNVNGITVTSKTSKISYGDQTSNTTEYGNLAYAPVTFGDASGKITTKRIPFFMYYKIVDQSGNVYPAHSSDVFGVGPGVSYANSVIASPLSYFDYGAGVTNGFKLATLSNAGFTSNGTDVAGLLTIGLVPNDLTSAGFILHPLTYAIPGGYSPNIPATITYNGTSVAAQILFDTGTPSVTIIEDKTAQAIGNLPTNSVVTVVTNKGFTYTYTTTSTANLTEVQNPNNTGDTRTIFSLDFFISNEFLTDYTNHQIGLKNN